MLGPFDPTDPQFANLSAMLQGGTQDQLGQLASMPQGPDLASQPAPQVQGAIAPTHNIRDGIKNAVAMFLLSAGRGYAAGGGMQGTGVALSTPFEMHQQAAALARQQAIDQANIMEHQAQAKLALAQAHKAENDILPNSNVDLTLLGKMAGETDPNILEALKSVPANSVDHVAKALNTKITERGKTPPKPANLEQKEITLGIPGQPETYYPGTTGPTKMTALLHPDNPIGQNYSIGQRFVDALKGPDIVRPDKPTGMEEELNLYRQAGYPNAQLPDLWRAKAAAGIQPGQGALADVPPHLIAPATAAAQKAGTAFSEANQAADDMKTFTALARSGNKQAYAYAPTEGVLTLNTSRGVKRVNISEISAYGGAGSALDRVKAFLGKQTAGASIPENILQDMDSLHAAVAKNAQSRYANDLKVTNATYGSKFTPVDLSGDVPQSSNGSGKAKTATGKNGHKIVVRGGKWVDAITGVPIK